MSLAMTYQIASVREPSSLDPNDVLSNFAVIKHSCPSPLIDLFVQSNLIVEDQIVFLDQYDLGNHSFHQEPHYFVHAKCPRELVIKNHMFLCELVIVKSNVNRGV